MMTERILRFALLVPFLLVLGGCGKSEATVTGHVNLDGAPLEKGTITFTSADGKGSPDTIDIKNGQYSLKMAPGPKHIEIHASKSAGTVEKYKDDPKSAVEKYVDVRFKTQDKMEYEVKPGPNEVPAFELTTR